MGKGKRLNFLGGKKERKIERILKTKRSTFSKADHFPDLIPYSLYCASMADLALSYGKASNVCLNPFPEAAN